MKKKIDYYSILIASKYFETIDDFINLEKAVKRFRGNIEKLHFNPISVDEKIVSFFPNIETLHLYRKEDKFLKKGRIQFYVIWYKVSYLEYLKIKEENENIQCKWIEYTQSCRK